MTFRTIPAHIAPGPDDVAALARKRAELDAKLDRHGWRERRIVAGSASTETVDVVLRNRHLSRVLAGPVALGPRMVRGAVSIMLLVILNAIAVFTLAISDAAARRGGCQAIAQRYIAAPAGSIAEARYRRAMIIESCYTEDGRP